LAIQSHLIGRKRHYLVSSDNRFASFYRELLMRQQRNARTIRFFLIMMSTITKARDNRFGASQRLGGAAASESAGADKPLVDGLRSRATVRAWSSIKSDTSLPCARR
jgi:hypothetical protein